MSVTGTWIFFLSCSLERFLWLFFNSIVQVIRSTGAIKYVSKISPACHLPGPFFLMQKVCFLVSCMLWATSFWALTGCYYLDRVIKAKCSLSCQMVLLILTGTLATLALTTVTPTPCAGQELEIVSSVNVRLASVEMETFVTVSEDFNSLPNES